MATLYSSGSKEKVEEHNNIKHHIKAIITGEIEVHKSNLTQVKDYIEEKLVNRLAPLTTLILKENT